MKYINHLTNYRKVNHVRPLERVYFMVSITEQCLTSQDGFGTFAGLSYSFSNIILAQCLPS